MKVIPVASSHSPFPFHPCLLELLQESQQERIKHSQTLPRAPKSPTKKKKYESSLRKNISESSSRYTSIFSFLKHMNLQPPYLSSRKRKPCSSSSLTSFASPNTSHRLRLGANCNQCYKQKKPTLKTVGFFYIFQLKN